MTVFGTIRNDATKQSQHLLQVAVALHWNMNTLPTIATGQWGKPYFQSNPHHHFNLSHSGDTVLCALSNSPVGVDIQRLRPSRSKFLDHICSPQERQWLSDFEDSEPAFALLWSLKESLCKYSGRGITRPIPHIVVPLPSLLPSSGTWETMSMGELSFSCCACLGGMVSICGEETPTQAIKWVTLSPDI